MTLTTNAPVPLDMGKPVPGFNWGAHLLQARNQTKPTRQRRTSWIGCYIQVIMIQWKWQKLLFSSAFTRWNMKVDSVIRKLDFIQGRLGYPSPPPYATYHPATHDLQGLVFLSFSLLPFLHLLYFALNLLIVICSTNLSLGRFFNWWGGHLFKACWGWFWKKIIVKNNFSMWWYRPAFRDQQLQFWHCPWFL